MASRLRDEVRSDDSGDTLSREKIFEILRNERRLYVLKYLKAHSNEVVTVEELVEYVAAHENDTPVEELTATQIKRMYTGLTQSHLPMLHENDVIHYDKQAAEVELTDRAREVELYLEWVPENEIPWPHYFLGLSLVAIAVLAANTFGIPPIGGVSVSVLSGVIVLAFLVSSAVYLREQKRNRVADEFDGR